MKRTRWLSAILAALMLFSLAACGKGDDEAKDPNLLQIGDYTLLYKDACIMEDYAGEDAIVLTLDFTNNTQRNAAYIGSIVEFPMQNEQELEFTAVYISADSDKMVSDGQMMDVAPGETLEIKTAFVLKDMTSEVEIRFEELIGDKSASLTIDPSTLKKETPGDSTGTSVVGGKGATAEGSSTVGSGETLLDWWNGDWYGWWMMTGCSGYYEDMEGDWWDICGIIDIGDNNIGTVVLWDEDYTKDDPMVSASVSLSEAGTGEYGTMMSEGGWFTDIDLGHADWIVDPGLLDYEDMIHIDGYYENGDDAFFYDIYLRPWGTYWDDMDAEDLPYYYDDWYLPLIGAGKSMPGSISVG